jgi:hypothetical protein
MTQRYVSSWWQQWCCIGGSCALPARPAHNRLERILDRYVGLTAPLLRGCLVFCVVGAVWAASFRFGPTAGLVLTAAYLTVHSTYCLSNFVRCREAHCIVTGIGWLVLVAVAVEGALAGQDFRRAVWDAFLAVAIAGFAVELIWTAARGSTALRLS